MPDDNKPRIIIDDDWKTRVQQEKESLRSGAGSEPGSPPLQPQHSDSQFPDATFDSLVSLLVTQALATLGQIPMGPQQQPVVMLDHAKHTIDLLGVLEQKTAGNLSPAESKMLDDVLHELRMLFVAAQSQTPPAR